MSCQPFAVWRSWKSPVYRALGLALCGAGLCVGGCTAFNPSFLALFEPSGGGSFQSLPPPPGHVVVGLINQTEIDERLLTYLKGIMQISDEEASNLRPRIRLRMRITYIDGTFLTVEFIDGSPDLIDPAFDAQAFPDLNQNDLNNAVALCDVARVELEPNTSIEVFMPVELDQYQLVETTGVGGDIVTSFELRGTITPQFWPLEIDTTDEDGNVILQQNIGVRDTLSPTPSVICGSVIAITVNGTLAVPFLDEVSPNKPSFDQDDEATEAQIGGRYEFIVTVQ